MVNIKAAQARIISSYASSCMSDVRDCYNQQNTQITSWTSSASIDNVYKVLTGACYNVALTCGYAVFAYDSDMGTQIGNVQCEDISGCATSEDGTACTTNSCTGLLESKRQSLLINGISELFYQTLLCPEKSSFVAENGTVSANRTMEGYVNNHCKCQSGYTVWNGSCVLSCGANEYRNDSGMCGLCESGTQLSGGTSDTEPNECVVGSASEP